MTVLTRRGIPQHADVQSAIPPTPREAIDVMVAELSEHQGEWARLPVPDRIAILGELRRDFVRVAERWAEVCREAEGIPPGVRAAGEEWLAGPYFILRNLRLLERALEGVRDHGQPRIPGEVHKHPSGHLSAEVFPFDVYDRLFYAGITAEVWMEHGVGREDLPETQALAYREQNPEGGVALVLGAGNVSSIGPMDALYKLFAENRVVLYKMHPLNAYLGPILAQGFQVLIDWGVLRIVYGGVDVGEYLTQHEGIDEIHVTGSDKTVEAIVFGPGEEGRLRKEQRKPRLDKPISSELGNVSPVIVVPGPWSQSDVDHQGESLVSMLVNNAGFNCNAARVIITQKDWEKRPALLDAVRGSLMRVPPRRAYYPGAEERHEAFVDEHPEAQFYGDAADDELPWTLIPNVDPGDDDEVAFTTEAFCSVFAETALEATSPFDFLEKAVEFANDRLWGTLNATIVVHPKTMELPGFKDAFEQALADLRYGTVAVNLWAAVGYGLVVPPWGAAPGHDVYDIQSGTGWVHNTLMFSRAEKTVVRGPFKLKPKPVWFPSNRMALELGKKLTDFEAEPSMLKVPKIVWTALRG